jgi:hypothetical protein
MSSIRAILFSVNRGPTTAADAAKSGKHQASRTSRPLS